MIISEEEALTKIIQIFQIVQTIIISINMPIENQENTIIMKLKKISQKEYQIGEVMQDNF